MGRSLETNHCRMKVRSDRQRPLTANRPTQRPPMETYSLPDRITSLVYSLDDLTLVTGLGRTRLYELINSGKLPARKAGRRTLVLREDVDAFLRSLPKVAS
jgi:excisionase family DNA binding protein